MRTTKNHKHTEYRIFKVDYYFEVWLVSFASGAKLKRVAKILLTQESAEEFKQWVLQREK